MLLKCCTQYASKFGKVSSGHRTGKGHVSFQSQRKAITNNVQFSSVYFSRSVMSDSLQPHELQHARPPCPSPTPRVHSDSHPYVTTGKTRALTRRTFVGKVISLLFNMLSRLVLTFLPRSKCLLISWLQSPSAVILEPPKIRSLTVSIVSPSICHEVMGPDAMISVF